MFREETALLLWEQQGMRGTLRNSAERVEKKKDSVRDRCMLGELDHECERV